MKEKITKYTIIIFSWLSVLYPLFIWYQNRGVTFDESFLQNIFPAFGLLAFSLLWLHVISASLEPWLEKYFDLEKFVKRTATLILISFTLHPLILLFLIDFDIKGLIEGGGIYIRLGIIGWLLLITYDIGRFLKKKYDFFNIHWRKIVIISTIGFFLIFFHSLALGVELQSGALRSLWIFYGISAFISAFYAYILKGLPRRPETNHNSTEE